MFRREIEDNSELLPMGAVVFFKLNNPITSQPYIETGIIMGTTEDGEETFYEVDSLRKSHLLPSEKIFTNYNDCLKTIKTI